MPQPAWLIYGPPGCGKTTWILAQVKQENKKLFHWNARTDRSLREGRENLHRQVRSQEPLIVWIEGADDLTPESQAFLRRILETASPNVICALEVRELWKMSSPILSRCTVVSMKLDNSLRSKSNTQKAIQIGLISPATPNKYETIRFKDLPGLRASAADPYAIFDHLISSSNDPLGMSKDLIEAIHAIGTGSSPWIQLAKYLMRQEMKGEGELQN